MWWSIVANGFILSFVIAVAYVIALDFYLGELDQEKIAAKIFIEKSTENLCPPNYGDFCACRTLGNTWSYCRETLDIHDTDLDLRKARTATFIAVVFAENVRAYTSRSFDRPFYQEMCSNIAMQKAILLAQVALWCVVFIPGLSDQIFELEGDMIGVTGYIIALGSAFSCLAICEAYKQLAKTHIKNFQAKMVRETEEKEAERQEMVYSGQHIDVDEEGRAIKEGEPVKRNSRRSLGSRRSGRLSNVSRHTDVLSNVEAPKDDRDVNQVQQEMLEANAMLAELSDMKNNPSMQNKYGTVTADQVNIKLD